MKLSRRDFTKLVSLAGLSAAATAGYGRFAIGGAAGRVVVIGGGVGGASVAHLLKKAAPELDITLVEPKKQYTTCFFSNHYLGGMRTIDQITHGYDGLSGLGIKVVHDLASGVDASKKSVALKSGAVLSYDKLVLSPGIDFKWETIEGYSPDAAKLMPHSWQGGEQTRILRQQLVDMKPGGTVVMAAPPNPFRCPPGPYERASIIAGFLKKNKPGSKLMIFDTKTSFSKMALFEEGWAQHYSDIIEWITPEITDGGIKKVDTSAMTVTTGDGDTVKAAVANIIPAQKAGKIAHVAGCTEGDWCPINADDFSSTLVSDVYVLGDSSIAAPMPKSGFSANSQAKVVVNAIAAELAGKKRFPARYRNTCWSMVSQNNAVKIGANYKPADGKLAAEGKFISKTGEDTGLRTKTFDESVSWYKAITGQMFAKG